MTEMTPQPAGSSILHATMPAHPDGRSKYAATVSYNDGVVALSVRYVEHAWLPLALFGRVIQTKLVRVAGDGIREMAVLNDEEGLSCSIARVGAPSERITLLRPEWPVALRESVRAEFDSALHRQSGGITFNLRGKTAILATLFVAYAMITGLSANRQMVAAPGAGPVAPISSAPATQAPVVSQLSPGEDAAMSSAAPAQAAADGQTTPMPIKEALSKASFITLRSASAGGKSLVIWSDPLCPHCRDFDQKLLAKLPATLGVTIIPVSFKHGSRPIVSYIACGATAADRAARWKNLMSEQPAGMDITQQCATGPAVADSNTALFARAGLRSTPTLMKADGQVFDGDLNSIEAVTSWLAK